MNRLSENSQKFHKMRNYEYEGRIDNSAGTSNSDEDSYDTVDNSIKKLKPIEPIEPVLMPLPNHKNYNSHNVNNDLEELKSRISNSKLKKKFNLKTLGEFFNNFINGNEFVDNLYVKDKTISNKDLKASTLTVKNTGTLKKIFTKNFYSGVLNITEHEIKFNKNAILRLGGDAKDSKTVNNITYKYII